MTFMEVYNSLDFQRYCQKLTTEWADLANDTAVVVLSLPTEKRTQIEKGGYMLRYAQRVALRTWGGSFRKQVDKAQLRQELIFNNLKDTDLTPVITPVMQVLKRHLATREYSIQAKMLLYAAHYGGAAKLAAKMGVPPRTIQRIIKDYIECLKSEL